MFAINIHIFLEKCTFFLCSFCYAALGDPSRAAHWRDSEQQNIACMTAAAATFFCRNAS